MPQALSRIEVIEKAARLVRDGELNPALQSYKQLFAQDPTDWAVGNALGDLYLRLGKTDDGIAHFMGLGEQLARDGYTAKARAIYRKILRVQPDNELASYRVVELDNQHLVEKSQSSPFMKRMLDTARAAAKQQAEIESSADRESSSGREATADAPPSQSMPAAQDAPASAASSVPAVQTDPSQELAAQPPPQPRPAPNVSQPPAAAEPQPALHAPPPEQPYAGAVPIPTEAPPEPHAPPVPQEPPVPQVPPAPPAPQTRPPVPARAANREAAGEQQPVLQSEPSHAQAGAAQPVPVVQARASGAAALQPPAPQNSPEQVISFDAGGDDWSAVDLEAAVDTPPPLEETARVLAPEEDDEIAAYEALLRETASEEWNSLEIDTAVEPAPFPSAPPADATVSESIPEDAVLLEMSSGEWSPVAFDDAAAPPAIDLLDDAEAPPTIDLFEDAAAPPAIDLASIVSEMGSQSFEPLEIAEEVDEIASDAAVEPVSAVLQPMRGTEQPCEQPIEEAIEFEELPDDWLSMTFQTAVLQRDPELEDEGDEDENARDFQKTERQARRAAARGDFDGATAALEGFLRRWPHHVSALETLIDISVDGGLEELVPAQVRLAEACMASGRVAQARNVAIDLLRRYPDDSRCQQVVGRIRDLALRRAEPGVAAAMPWQGAAPAASKPAAASSQMDFVLEAVGPEDLFDFGAPLIDQEDGFEEIRIGLLEDVATVAEEGFASASRLINAHDFPQAIGLLEEAVCVPHLRHSGGARLAQAYRESGDCLKALDCLEWAAERPPLNEESGHVLAYELALTLEAVGELQQALGVYRELLAEVGPTFRDVADRAARLRAA